MIRYLDLEDDVGYEERLTSVSLAGSLSGGIAVVYEKLRYKFFCSTVESFLALRHTFTTLETEVGVV